MSFVMSSTIQPSRVRYTITDKNGNKWRTTTDFEEAKDDAYILGGQVRIEYQEIK